MNDTTEQEAEWSTSHGPNVEEIHIDFLLQEELQCSEQFLKRFLAACGRQDYKALLEPITRSLSDSYGEADLAFRYQSKNGGAIAVFIEDKIGANLQPRQLERYDERGRAGMGGGSGKWDEYVCCLVGPDRYIRQVNNFEFKISLEEIKNWLSEYPDDEANEQRRRKFRQSILQQAIEKESTQGPKIIDADITRFRQSFYRLLKDKFPDFAMNPPKPSYAGETWFRIRHRWIDDSRAFMTYKSERGFVDLGFADTDVSRLAGMAERLEFGMKPEPTGKSSSIRLIVEKITDFRNFEENIPKLQSALGAASRLAYFFRREREKIATLLGP